MCSGTSIALIAAAVVAAGSSAYAASQSGAPDIKQGETPPVPSGPATIPDKTNFQGLRSTKPLDAPQGVSFGGALSDAQKRSQIATQALAGSSGEYKTPEVQQYYKNLAINTLTDEAGNPSGEPLGIEKQYLSQVLGQTPRQPGTGSFLSALLRS